MSTSLYGRTALITGGTDGIGREVARGLAREGLRLVIVGRDSEKGARAEQELRRSTGNPDVLFQQCDLGSMRDVSRLANEVQARLQSLQYLVHSAGVVFGRRELTTEGIESNFAINYLSRFLLTAQLIPLLAAAGRSGRAGRILLVSGAAQAGRIYFDDVNLTSNFATPRAVLQVCHANDLFCFELTRRLSMEPEGFRITITCLKLGVVKTNIRQHFPGWMKVLVPLILDPLIGQTPADAATAAVRLLLADEFEDVTGVLFLKIRKLKQVLDTHRLSGEDARRLWELSERLVANALAPIAT